MSIARRLVLASVVLSVVVSAAFLVLVFANSALSDATERQARASEITSTTLVLEKLVVDLETGLRGLVLTGNERFLRPYVTARRELPAQLAEFERLVEDDTVQERRAAGLASLIRAY